MYIPDAFREDDSEKLIAFMRANSFATLVTARDCIPCASHVPLVQDLRRRANCYRAVDC